MTGLDVIKDFHEAGAKYGNGLTLEEYLKTVETKDCPMEYGIPGDCGYGCEPCWKEALESEVSE